MKHQIQRPFLQTPRTVLGHFVLNLYAAIYYLFQYIQWLEQFGGSSLELMYKRYPFLVHYQNQLQQNMPQGVTAEEGGLWWQESIGDWEQQCDIHLPLKALTDTCQFSFSKRMALVICGLVEEDSRFGTLLAELQAPLSHRFVTLELLGNVLGCQSSVASSNREDISQECQSLINEGFVDCLNTDSARSEWLLRVPSTIWEIIRTGVQEKPVHGCHYHTPDRYPAIRQLIYSDGFLNSLKRVPALIDNDQVKTLILRSDPGSDPVEVMGAVASTLKNQGVLLLSLQASKDEKILRLAGPLSVLSNAIPVLEYVLAPGETVQIPEFNAWQGAVGVCLGGEGGLKGSELAYSLTLTLPMLDRQLRMQHWQQVLGKDNPAIETIADTFQVSGKYIKQMAGMAISLARIEEAENVQLEQVREASRSLNRQTLENLADHLPTSGSWQNLICNHTTDSKLHELQQRCTHRERLLEHLGPAFKNNANRGVRALFTGVSGTGKTLAAKILAAELGMDLYRVDLAAVINKYIGETEKNLHKILARAEALDIVLLLDEGDSLLGGRTDVKSSNDRYANLETNYLLQRLEHYQGIILITTNLNENIDKAFQRRMDVLIPFFPPGSEERFSIMQLHLPDNNQASIEFLMQIARQCSLNGGQIRNVVSNAALNALEEGYVMQDCHIEKALKDEYQKAGGIYPLHTDDVLNAAHPDEVDSLIQALQEVKY